MTVAEFARTSVKRAVECALIRSGSAALSRRHMRGHVLVIAYHNVIPDGLAACGDVANHLPVGQFRAQLDELTRTHDIIALSDSSLKASRNSQRPRAAITFDDAYRGALRHALPELVQRKIPATIFVAPAVLGDQGFWWDVLADSNGRGLDLAIRERALGELEGRNERILAWANTMGRKPVPLDAIFRSATMDELVEAAAMPGIQLGSHSWSHANLPQLDDSRLAEELMTPLLWLRECGMPFVPWIAYPYGSLDKRVSRAAAKAGYSAGLKIVGGWTNENARGFNISRVNIPAGLSLNGFCLRASGLFCD